MVTETEEWEEIRMESADFIERTLKEAELAKKESREPRVSSSYIRFAEHMKYQDSLPPDYEDPAPPRYHVKATTLFEIFSISIQRYTQECNDVGSSFEVYGHIKLINEYGREFVLFECEHDDPVTVSMLDNRTAILPKSESYCPRWLPEYFCLELYLVDKSRNVTIVNAARKLDFQGNDVRYDEEQAIIFSSEGYGRVTLNYTIFRSALLAIMTLQVSKNGSGTDESKVAVTGSICANTEVKGERGLSRLLCDVQSMSFTINDRIGTYLPPLAVPAYSLVRIKADLVVNGERIVSTGDDALEFEPVGFASAMCKEITRGGWCICLSLNWRHAYQYLDQDECGSESVSPARWETEDFSDEMRFRPMQYARSLVEVFSVYVGSFRHERPLRVYGTIVFRVYGYGNKHDLTEEYIIFDSEKTGPEIVTPNQPISLLEPCPRCEIVDAFEMHLDLKDAGRGREISKGSFEWSFHRAFNWFDERICSVVKGEHGFACVHYAIFNVAVRAKVRVRLLSSSSSNDHHPVCECECEVSGSIYARYSTYRCSTNYEKNFYRSTLFEQKTLEICALQTDMPLSKDVVAVPSHAALILDVEIHVRAGGGGFDEMIRGELEFDPHCSPRICAKTIQGKIPREKTAIH